MLSNYEFAPTGQAEMQRRLAQENLRILFFYYKNVHFAQDFCKMIKIFSLD